MSKTGKSADELEAAIREKYARLGGIRPLSGVRIEELCESNLDHNWKARPVPDLHGNDLCALVTAMSDVRRGCDLVSID